jgi:carboxylesterase type B
VVSPPNGCDTEFRLFQQSLPCPTFHISDLHGLHLNITAPIGAKNLPVLVFIHGGGFAVGSNAWPQYNHARLVNLSVKKGLPIVAVGIK